MFAVGGAVTIGGAVLLGIGAKKFKEDKAQRDAKAYAEIVHGETSLPPVLKGPDRATWYPRMADSLFDLRRHVRIARAIAACWFDGRPNLPDGYVQSIDTLHATICIEGRDLERVAARFERLGPAFVESSVGDVDGAGNDGWNAGNARRDSLIAGREIIREATLDFLRGEDLGSPSPLPPFPSSRLLLLVLRFRSTAESCQLTSHLGIDAVEDVLPRHAH